jgi:hypothetical protein
MSKEIPPLDEWDPLVPDEVARLFGDYPSFWAVAGGWAIDLILGQQTRSHADIDIQIDRRDAALFHGSLPGWQLYQANRVVCEWTEGAEVPIVVSDIWCRQPEGPWKFQVMLGEFDARSWYYKRDRSITGPIARFTIDADGLPVVAPEIQLLYKSTRPHLPKNEHDFLRTLPRLDDDRRNWLIEALRLTDPTNPWLPRLDPG